MDNEAKQIIVEDDREWRKYSLDWMLRMDKRLRNVEIKLYGYIGGSVVIIGLIVLNYKKFF